MRILFFLITISSNLVLCAKAPVRLFESTDAIEFDSLPHMMNDMAFESAFTELSEMFDGNKPQSLKRAEFLIENAYRNGGQSYYQFCHDIDSIVTALNNFIKERNIQNYRTAPNYALFEFFTKPSKINGNKIFTYDFEDPAGNNDYSSTFITKLLKTHSGQCTSMPLLYKILCDELGGHSKLALAPLHLYVKHIGEDGRWVNVELTHGGFVRDVWMMESMNISTEAIRNGTFLCALSDTENMAFMLMQLAKAYNSKYKATSFDYFTERCVDKVLNKLPNFSDALVMKLNLIQNYGTKYIQTFGPDNSEFITHMHQEMWKTINHLDSIGYSQPTQDEYKSNIEEGKRWLENKLNHE